MSAFGYGGYGSPVEQVHDVGFSGSQKEIDKIELYKHCTSIVKHVWYLLVTSTPISTTPLHPISIPGKEAKKHKPNTPFVFGLSSLPISLFPISLSLLVSPLLTPLPLFYRQYNNKQQTPTHPTPHPLSPTLALNSPLPLVRWPTMTPSPPTKSGPIP